MPSPISWIHISAAVLACCYYIEEIKVCRWPVTWYCHHKQASNLYHCLWYRWLTIYTWRGLLLITSNRVWYKSCLINHWDKEKGLSSLYWCHSVWTPNYYAMQYNVFVLTQWRMWGGLYMRVYGNILEFCQNELQIRFSIQPGMNLAFPSINKSHSVHAIGVHRSPVQSRLYSNDIFWHYMAVTYSHLYKYHLPGMVISYVHG